MARVILTRSKTAVDKILNQAGLERENHVVIRYLHCDRYFKKVLI